ncbi:unnamed protein product [Vitrella brassicaformis CCMP3155]|uniref:Hexose transporter 1 n=1 Tax=Vitrella brassicaformis (strain CCMP3155) TaxID=1169540 RepID=A0A0G4GWH8_VITBC|nr:unnamed protein product [Vitrella brassicaformis CCMP3155]|eukprot:CEM35291.1 unnamed protein product [Vitrella brassicaformis CCMP3155]
MADNKPLLLYFVVGFTALTGLLLGYDLSVVAIILEPVRLEFNLCGGAFSCFEKQLMVALPAPGAVVGALFAGSLAKDMSRVVSMGISDGCIVIAAVLMAVAQRYWILLAGRFIVGVGVGIGMVTFSTYVAEIAPERERGQLVLCQEICQCLGVMCSFGVAAMLTDPAPYWRVLLGAVAIAGLLQAIGLILLPESPRWLVIQGRVDVAKETMLKLGAAQEDIDTQLHAMIREKRRAEALTRRGSLQSRMGTFDFSHVFPDPFEASKQHSPQQKEEQEQQQQQQPTEAAAVGEATPLTKGDQGDGQGEMDNVGAMLQVTLGRQLRRHRTELAIAVGCAAANNMTGAPAVLPYSTDVLMLAGVSARSSYIAGVGIGLVKTIGVFVTFLTVDQLGRKTLLIAGTAGMLMCHLLFASAFAMAGAWSSAAAVSVVAMLLYMFFWNLCWAGLMYVVASEVLPSHLRGFGMGIVVVAFWALAFCTGATFETLFNTLSIAGTFLLFGGFTFLVLLFTIVSVPETSGKSLEQIAAGFHKSRQDKKRAAPPTRQTGGNECSAVAAAGVAEPTRVVQRGVSAEVR